MGEGGSGKTATLREAARIAALEEARWLRSKRSMVIYARVADFHYYQERDETVRVQLSQSMELLTGRHFGRDNIDKFVEEGRLRLFLDGFDEELAPYPQKRLLQVCHDITGPGGQVVVTSRPHGASRTKVGEVHFQELELSALDRSRRIRILRNVLPPRFTLGEGHYTPASLENQITWHHPPLAHALENPLCLTLYCIVVRDQLEHPTPTANLPLPTSATRLFDLYFEWAVRRALEARVPEELALIEYWRRMAFLEVLDRLQEGGAIGWEGWLADAPWPKTGAEFAREVVTGARKAGLVVERHRADLGVSWRFQHEVLRDDLVAQFLLQEGAEQLDVATLVGTPAWRRSFLMLMEKSPALPFLEAAMGLLKAPRDPRQPAVQDLFMVLAEAVHRRRMAGEPMPEALTTPLEAQVRGAAATGDPCTQVRMLHAAAHLGIVSFTKVAQQTQQTPVRWVQEEAVRLRDEVLTREAEDQMSTHLLGLLAREELSLPRCLALIRRVEPGSRAQDLRWALVFVVLRVVALAVGLAAVGSVVGLLQGPTPVETHFGLGALATLLGTLVRPRFGSSPLWVVAGGVAAVLSGGWAGFQVGWSESLLSTLKVMVPAAGLMLGGALVVGVALHLLLVVGYSASRPPLRRWLVFRRAVKQAADLSPTSWALLALGTLGGTLYLLSKVPWLVDGLMFGGLCLLGAAIVWTLLHTRKGRISVALMAVVALLITLGKDTPLAESDEISLLLPTVLGVALVWRLAGWRLMLAVSALVVMGAVVVPAGWGLLASVDWASLAKEIPWSLVAALGSVLTLQRKSGLGFGLGVGLLTAAVLLLIPLREDPVFVPVSAPQNAHVPLSHWPAAYIFMGLTVLLLLMACKEARERPHGLGAAFHFLSAGVSALVSLSIIVSLALKGVPFAELERPVLMAVGAGVLLFNLSAQRGRGRRAHALALLSGIALLVSIWLLFSPGLRSIGYSLLGVALSMTALRIFGRSRAKNTGGPTPAPIPTPRRLAALLHRLAALLRRLMAAFPPGALLLAKMGLVLGLFYLLALSLGAGLRAAEAPWSGKVVLVLGCLVLARWAWGAAFTWWIHRGAPDWWIHRETTGDPRALLQRWLQVPFSDLQEPWSSRYWSWRFELEAFATREAREPSNPDPRRTKHDRGERQ